jgi:recombination protein RecR
MQTDSLHKLIEYFVEFPGIGPRQARRFAYFLLTKNPGYLGELSNLISEIKKDIHVCSSCFRFFTASKGSGKTTICPICSDTSRDASLLTVIARDVDLEAVERSGAYGGHYFVLGGTVPILDKTPHTRVRSNELIKHLESNPQIKEVILSLNANPEGEHTADYIKNILKTFAEKNSLTISILGRGLSTGTELEYSDSDTIKNALRNRA